MQVRSILGDFAVLVAIVLWTSVDLLLALDTPKLNVPTEIKPTSASRSVPIYTVTPSSRKFQQTAFSHVAY